VLPRFVSTFTETGGTLCLQPQAQQEIRDMFQSAPAWARVMRGLVVAHFRLRRLLRGGYSQAPYAYANYTPENPSQRRVFRVEHPTGRWKTRGAKPEEGGVRARQDQSRAGSRELQNCYLRFLQPDQPSIPSRLKPAR